MRGLRRAAVGLAIAALAVAPAVAAAPPVPVERLRSETAAGVAFALGGTLVSALASGADGALWLLVRPVGEPDGPRRLLRVELAPEPAVSVVLDGVEGWTKTLAAIDLGSGPELLAGGLGRLDSIGPLPAPALPGRPLIDHPGFDLRSLAPHPLRTGVESRLAAAEVGRLRIWVPDAGSLRLDADLALPFTAERTASGLRLSGPRVAPVSVGPTATQWIVGPVAVGRDRLRTLLLGAGGGGPIEAWSALPGPETVEAAWAVALDGEPALVVRTQGAGAIDLFERQRLRVLPLRGDRTRAGVAPALAAELDAKRWQPTEVAAEDVDGDGRTDLIALHPEGLTGGDLVVEVFAGTGGGRLASRARRTDLDDAPDGWRLLPAATPEGRPALLMVWPDRVELRALAAEGRRAVEATPRLTLTLAAAAAAPGPATVRVGGEGGAEVERRTEVEAFGAAELDGRPGQELLILAPAADGGDRLILVRGARDR